VYALEPFFAVGLWYEDFQQTTDEEVERLLAIADAGGINARHAI
jgi:predicted phosphoribosyltransferase